MAFRPFGGVRPAAVRSPRQSGDAGGPPRSPTVDAAYTSRRCPRCGHTERANRSDRDRFRCRRCGLAGPADVVAGVNAVHGREGDESRSTCPTAAAPPFSPRAAALGGAVRALVSWLLSQTD
ncbi:zinc ribbon domain-containing protein [Streptomyces asiaticus]